jgi:preprotein translocase subunit SecA
VQAVRRRAAVLSGLSERSFRTAADALRAAIRTPTDATQTDHAIESFALTDEALRRVTGWQYHDAQLIASFALAAGTIAEIQTGEGKTILTALPAVLHAWCGLGVHVATTNDYLSQRDHETLRPVYASLGLTSACLLPQQHAHEKRTAYACDVTYGPGYEFGFDFLRDQIAARQSRRRPLGERYLRRLSGQSDLESGFVQRGLSYALIDEADSVMIDEAVTPLIVSGDPETEQTDAEVYRLAREVARTLQAGADFRVDPSSQRIEWTEAGLETLARSRGRVPSGRRTRRWNDLVLNAVRAEVLLRRDVDYVVDADGVVLVDPHTGRLHPERRWSGGLQQAVEVKENLSVTAETITRGRITRQRYLGLYPRLAGMTGTAAEGEAELREFYRLPVVQIPTHQPCRRRWLPPRVFVDRAAKLSALVDDARDRAARGQPVLIGTASIEQSRRVAECLQQHSIPHTVLNGVQDEREAAIVGQAGRAGQVTVATNMAGRGTDIRLDDAARSVGGLHVIGAEMHSSGRVDRQLAGRAARQGDPGSCQFFVSAEDEWLVRQDSRLAGRIRQAGGAAGECRVDVSAALARLQRKAEFNAWQQRREMVARDDWFESVQSSLARRA